MLIVVADDFSGAAEIGGIAHRYGLSAEVQMKFNSHTHADLVILDTDTRGLSMEEAIIKMKAIANDLKRAGQSIQFKKVDSVFRGHIVPEINVLQEQFIYKRILLLPANPRRGRNIISGHYFVHEVSLEKTVFASDPYFPAASSSIKKIIDNRYSVLPHVHLSTNSDLPASALVTGDVASKEDIRNYIKQTGNDDLCCGAAECFEVYLENKGHGPNNNWSANEDDLQWPRYTLIISGSTVKDQFETDELKNAYFPILSLPGCWNADRFVLEKDEEEAWQTKVLELLQRNKLAAIAIHLEVKKTGDTEIFAPFFIRLMHYISGKLGRENIHFAITGGATASEIIKKEGNFSLTVKKEIAPGIVTLINEKSRVLFTVKPGSYLWPTVFTERLSSKTNQFE